MKKKLFSLVLAVLMVLGVSTIVYAGDDGIPLPHRPPAPHHICITVPSYPASDDMLSSLYQT